VGATRLDDLSPNDRKLVRQFALMELTTLFDQYNIDTGRPPKVKKKGKGQLTLFLMLYQYPNAIA
jgi:hypothetical protein